MMNVATAATVDAKSFAYVRQLVFEKAAIALEATKDYLIESRLTPLARRFGLNSIDELVLHLRDAPFGALHDQVVEAMTTNETSFFRDEHPFDVLRTAILPELIERRKTSRSLQIWSAACSSGQEAYSIALVLREHFPELAGWNVKIHATDLSQEMLRRAVAGSFSQHEVNRGLPLALLAKHFQRNGTNWVIGSELRKMISFRQLNLLEPWHTLPKFDVVFMRNVLIYFNVDTKRLILDKVFRQLAEDGTLFLGGAETTLGIYDQFERVPIGKTTTYRPI